MRKLFLVYFLSLVVSTLLLSGTSHAQIKKVIRASDEMFSLFSKDSFTKAPPSVEKDDLIRAINKGIGIEVSSFLDYLTALKESEILNSKDEGLIEEYLQNRSTLRMDLAANLKRILNKTKFFYVDTLNKYLIKKLSILEQGSLSKETETGEKVEGLYTVYDAVAFYSDLFRATDPEIKNTLIYIFSNPFRQKNLFNNQVERVFTNLLSPNFTSQILDSQIYSPKDIEKINDFIQNTPYKIKEIDGFYLLGGGFSFQLLHDILSRAKNLNNPALTKKIIRLFQFTSEKGIPLSYNPRLNAVAYYTPMFDTTTVSKPQFFNEDAWVHETTHARFHLFMDRLEKWSVQFDYALPYEITGPNQGFLNLLNEVNSWRTGTAFNKGGPLPMEVIINILSNSYGAQAGQEAADLFAKVWSPEKLNEKGVGWIIYHAIKKFNQIKDSEIVDMGKAALKSRSLVDQMNFVELVHHRDQRLKPYEAEISTILKNLLKKSPFEDVKILSDQLATQWIKGYQSVYTSEQQDFNSLLSLSFEELWTLFKRDKAPVLGFLIYKKFPDEIKLEHLEDLLRFALHPPQTGESNKDRIGLLWSILETHNIHRTQGHSNVSPVSRWRAPLDPSHPWLKKMDDLLANKLLFNPKENAEFSSQQLIYLLSEVTYPSELPQLYKKSLSQLLMADDSSRNLEIPISFFTSIGQETNPIPWGEKLIFDLFQKKKQVLNRGLNATIGEFIRLGMGNYFSQNNSWGQSIFLNARLSPENRKLNEAVLNNILLSPSENERFTKTAEILWSFLNDRSVVVKLSAVYAVASEPTFLLYLKDRLIEASQKKGNEYVPIKRSIQYIIDFVGTDFLYEFKPIVEQHPDLVNRSQFLATPYQCKDIFFLR